MTARGWAEVALLVIAAGTSWGYAHERDDRLKAEGRLEIVSARADSSADAAGVAAAAAVRADTARAQAERQAEAARTEGARRAAAAVASIPRAVANVVTAAAPADSAAVRARLDELEAVHAERDAGLLQQIAADSTELAGLRAVHVADLAAIKSLEGALADSQARAAAALRARPSWIQRNAPKAAIVMAAVGGWVVRGLLKG